MLLSSKVGRKYTSEEVFERFSFKCRKIISFAFSMPHDWLKNSQHFFNQSEVQQKPIVTRSQASSRALRQLHEITSSFDWLTVFSMSVVIG